MIFELIADRIGELQFQLLLLGVTTWLAVSLAAGVLASLKGHSGAQFGLVSAVISPLLGLVIVAVLPDRRRVHIDALEQRLQSLEQARGAQTHGDAGSSPIASGHLAAPAAPAPSPAQPAVDAKEDRAGAIGVMIVIGLVVVVILASILTSGRA